MATAGESSDSSAAEETAKATGEELGVAESGIPEPDPVFAAHSSEESSGHQQSKQESLSSPPVPADFFNAASSGEVALGTFTPPVTMTEPLARSQSQAPESKSAPSSASTDFFTATAFHLNQPATVQSQNRADLEEPQARERANPEKRQAPGPDEFDAPPVIAKPFGFKPKDQAATTAQDDDDDDDAHHHPAHNDHSTDTSHSTAPRRRSFSDASTLKAHADSSTDETAIEGEKVGFFQEQASFLGMTMSRGNQIWLIAILGFISVVVFQTFITLSGAVLKGGTPDHAEPQNSTLSMTGQWELHASTDQGTTNGIIQFQQSGSDLKGGGKDVMGNGPLFSASTPEKCLPKGSSALRKRI